MRNPPVERDDETLGLTDPSVTRRDFVKEMGLPTEFDALQWERKASGTAGQHHLVLDRLARGLQSITLLAKAYP